MKGWLYLILIKIIYIPAECKSICRAQIAAGDILDRLPRRSRQIAPDVSHESLENTGH
jgi:hypothetical protein